MISKAKRIKFFIKKELIILLKLVVLFIKLLWHIVFIGLILSGDGFN